LDRTAKVLEKIKMAGVLELDLCSVVEWAKKLPVAANASKTKLLSINQFRKLSLPDMVQF